MFIVVTHIDAITGILGTQEPMKNGPVIPKINGLSIKFGTVIGQFLACNPDGTYVYPPLYYGECDDDADISLEGVVKVISQQEFDEERKKEHLARKPYPSWVGDIETMDWRPPIRPPQISWNEDTVSWDVIYLK
jgi:hypothetical protein